MGWHGTPDDLICLAHEAAHALQILLSDHALMPPLARETCAFLGELILINHIRKNDAELFCALSQVWYNENDAYLGGDMNALSTALLDAEAEYHYRLNYPIARLTAAQIFCSSEKSDFSALFSSGNQAMSHLPLEDMANNAGESSNYLPPLPAANLGNPADDDYRALGAIALLDIDYWQGESEARITDYYTTALGHLQNRSLFIALNRLRKPVGYATWHKSSPSAPAILTRQAAPFGDHLSLQKAVERHLQQPGQIFAQHSRSARKEQIAW